MKILIADDDPDLRGMLEMLLAAEGNCTVVSAADGNEAQAALWADDPPRLAVLDWPHAAWWHGGHAAVKTLE